MSVVIDIAAQFTGQKAFRGAESAADKLGKSVKRALIGVGVTAFAKSAITAFAENQKQLELFKNSLKNIGFQFATGDALSFLNTLKLQYGIVDEQLLPAYQQLLTTTKSLGAAQNLTNLSLDLAANQGISVTEAADILSKAYLGNTKRLGTLKLGLDKATLASGDFAKIIKEVTRLTAGSAAAGANTFAGKLQRIKLAADQARESIGEGLVNAILTLTKSGSVEELQTKIINFGLAAKTVFENIGQAISENIRLIKVLGTTLVTLFIGTKLIAGIVAIITTIKSLSKAYKALTTSAAAASVASMFALNPLGAAAMAAGMVLTIAGVVKALDSLIDKAMTAQGTIAEVSGFTDTLNKYGSPASNAAAKAAKLAKETLAIDKARLKVLQDQTKLNRAAALFDTDKIQIIAALQRDITDQERLRLNLQLALLTKNVDEADRLSKELLISQGRTTGLAAVIAALPKALNPFEDYPQYVQDVLAQLALIAAAQKGLTVRTTTTTTPTPTTQTNNTLAADVARLNAVKENILSLQEKVAATKKIPDTSAEQDVRDALASYLAADKNMREIMPSINIEINNAGNVVTSQDLVNDVRNGLLNSGLSGSPSSIGRLLGSFQ